MPAAQAAAVGKLLIRLLRTHSEAQLYQTLASAVPEIIDVNRCSVALLENDANLCRLHGIEGLHINFPVGIEFAVNDTGISKAIQTGKVHRWTATENSAEREAVNLLKLGLCGVINAPLLVESDVVGTLNVAAKAPCSDETVAMIIEIAAMVSANIERFRAIGRSQSELQLSHERAQRLEALNDAAKVFSRSTTVADVFSIISDVTPKLVPARRISLAKRLDDGENVQIVGLVKGENDPFTLDNGTVMRLQGSMLDAVMQSDTPQLVPDLAHSEHPQHRLLAKSGLSAGVSIPVPLQGRTEYAINVAVAGDDVISPDHVTGLMTLGGLVSSVLERIDAQNEILARDRKIASLVDDCPLLMITLDRDLRPVQVSEFGAAKFGYQANELLKKPLISMYPESTATICLDELNRIKSLPIGQTDSFETQMFDGEGNTLWVRHTARRLADNKIPLLVVFENVTDLKVMSEQLTHDATHDPLTGLVNRREFDRRLAAAAQIVNAGSAMACVCYIDLDYFKIVNDMAGHNAGDALLLQLVSRLSATLDGKHTLGRLGGDEFAVLLIDCDLDEGMHIAERLRSDAEALVFNWEGRPYSATISVGVASVESGIDNVSKVLKAADDACYSAKNSGRNAVSAGSVASTGERRSDGEWATRVREAMKSNDLCLAAQTIMPVTADDGRLRFETLLRLRENDELIPAGVFIPAAERLGLISTLDEWVTTTVLDKLNTYYHQIDEIEFCTVNLSARSIESAVFQERLVRLLSRNPEISKKLVFEITETSALSKFSQARQFVLAVQKLGPSFAIDDFGAGFSTFHYLKLLPVKYLKIDGSLIRDLATDQIDLEIVRSITQVAKVLNINTVAEFVEDKSQISKLIELGVDLAQGYGIEKPILFDTMLNRTEPLLHTKKTA